MNVSAVSSAVLAQHAAAVSRPMDGDGDHDGSPAPAAAAPAAAAATVAAKGRVDLYA